MRYPWMPFLGLAILAAAAACASSPAAEPVPSPWEVVRAWNAALRDGDTLLAGRHTSSTSSEHIRQSIGSLEGLARTYARTRRERGFGESVLLGQDAAGDTATVEYLTFYGDGSARRYTDRLFREDGVWKVAPQFVRSARAPEAAARRAGVDLPAILPTLADFPEGVLLVDSGFSAGGIAAYDRRFAAAQGTFLWGASRVLQVAVTITLYSDADQAREAVQAQSTESVAASLDESVRGPVSVNVDSTTVSVDGDEVKSWVARLTGGARSVELYLISLAEDRLVLRVMMIGTAGEMTTADFQHFVRTIHQRMHRLPDQR